MNRPRLNPGLRIAWSVGCGVLCVLLIALWVRSFWYEDHITYIHSNDRFTQFGTHLRTAYLSHGDMPHQMLSGMKRKLVGWSDSRSPAEKSQDSSQFQLHISPRLMVRVPYWFLVLVFTSIAAVPWPPWSTRFSLRTLLIATTLIAVVLGLAVWAMSN